MHAKFQRDISIHGWDKTTSGFGRRMAAILKFYFRFRFWPMHDHRRVILPAKFRSNRTIVDGVMTAYRFFKMAATELEVYFHVHVSWRYAFKVEIYPRSKFQWDSSVHGRDITTSGFGKRKVAALEFYFWFQFWSMYSHRHTILHLPAKFRSSRIIVGGVMTSYPLFTRWQPAAILDLCG